MPGRLDFGQSIAEMGGPTSVVVLNFGAAAASGPGRGCRFPRTLLDDYGFFAIDS